MNYQRLLPVLRSLRFRLMLWNAGAVALTGLAILLAVREGVRYTLLYDLDQVLREDLKEIELHFQDGKEYDWPALQEEMNRKALGHDFHGWFVRFYDRRGEPTWSSVNTPDFPPPTDEQKRQRTFSLPEFRLSYRPLSRPIPEAAAVCVGCRRSFIARDMYRIDRLVMIVAGGVLLASPLAGFVLAGRTIQPLANMIRTTARIRPGELDMRVPLRGTGDELDSLARTINGLLDRIADYLQQEHDFLANAAHELRTPLAAIRSSVEVALAGDRNEEEYRELLGLVIEQCSALQTLVNQLLLLAESDADRLQTDAQPVRLDRLVASAVEMFQGVAEDHGIELKVSVGEPVAVPGNRHHLRQVLNNLLDNAVKFTAVKLDGAGKTSGEPGTITLALVRDDKRGMARLTIEDNGVGISQEHLPHVFERFYRADRSRAREGLAGGSGLGLSICRAIVEAHHGTISVASTVGVGTQFVIHLPLASSATDASELDTVQPHRKAT